MFANAYEKASKYTRPVIQSFRYFDNSIESGLSAFIILNSEGYILTVAHTVQSFLIHQNNMREVAEYNIAKSKILSDRNLNGSIQKKRISKLKTNPKWIINHSFWWGMDNVRIDNLEAIPVADLAIGRLIPLNVPVDFEYPKFKNPNKMRIGTSLCKLGYPFYNIQTTWDENRKGFIIPPSTFPIPRFPIEGMYTRNLLVKTPDNREFKLLETSTPGLKGQSGGPIFDVDGNIWAMQSRTHNFPLGFSPKVKKGNKEIEENQFLNVGLGVHAATIIEALSDKNIQFQMID